MTRKTQDEWQRIAARSWDLQVFMGDLDIDQVDFEAGLAAIDRDGGGIALGELVAALGAARCAA